MARIALISCPSEDYLYLIDERRRKRFPNLGLLYLATYLQEFGHELKVYDFWQKGFQWQDFVKELDRFQPDILGFNVHTEAFKISSEMSQFFKQRYPQTRIVWGGAFPTFSYQNILKNGNSVDFIVRYEGEVVFSRLVKHIMDPTALSVDAIGGVAYRENGHVRANPREKPIPDLNRLPFPDRDYLTFSEYELPISISSTRGCPSECTFCSARAYWPGRVRYRSAENIFQEIMFLYEKYGLLEFVIVDDTFTAIPRRSIEFCNRLQETGIPFMWSCASRADVASRELLEALYNAGCREIQFGVESGSQEVLNKIRKGVTLEMIRNAFRLSHDIGLCGLGSFILGHPWDTIDTMKQTMNFVLDLRRRYNVIMYASPNIPFPGSYQYEHADELGITIHAKNWGEYRLNNPIVSTPNFTLDQLREIFFHCQEQISF